MKPESPDATEISRLIDLREARLLLGGISPQLLYTLVREGDLLLVKIRRRSFVRESDIRALIDRSTSRVQQ